MMSGDTAEIRTGCPSNTVVGRCASPVGVHRLKCAMYGKKKTICSSLLNIIIIIIESFYSLRSTGHP